MSSPVIPRVTWLAFAVILALGLYLRVLAAGGGLWTDEAWSVLYAADANGPLGVITAINHDNNHHINSWWLQLVGQDASPLAARMLAILSGTATILVVGLIGQRRGSLAGVLTALLLAVSPIMVLYGSEARGYAPMMLCLALAVWRIDGWMHQQSEPFPRVTIALLALIGALSHLLMVPGLALLGLWVLLELRRSLPFAKAFSRTVEAMIPAGIAAIGVVAMVILSASASPDGMRVGGYTAFDASLYGVALGDLSGLLTGIGPVFGSVPLALGLALVLIALPIALPARFPEHRRTLYAVLLITLPLLVLLLRPGNSQFARYHLPLALGFILLAGDWISTHLAHKDWRRIVAVALLAILVGGNLHRDLALIANQRGSSSVPVEELARRVPGGTALRLNLERARAIAKVAAWQRDYPLNLRVADCGTEPFLLVDRTGDGPSKPSLTQCGRDYHQIAAADAISASGQSWTLYAQQALPTPKPTVNSAPPGR